ncbi:hypothetical protein DMN91_011381 [Ooceraea biroi]|uniref:Uncharacterized protein n=1 Tax=Ooceraea biroi TaxID=2015173 RepID=A0A3L8D6Y7_OOCBI|nr:hypothetical protein DMN91_011381 [Ooceraea biroi]
MPKRHRKSADTDSIEKLKKKICKYQKKLETRQQTAFEVRSSQSTLETDQEIMSPQVNFGRPSAEQEDSMLLDLENIENSPPEEAGLCEEILKFLGDNPKMSKAVDPKTLEKTKSADFLFGKELSEKIKQVEVMKKMAKTLKEQPCKKQGNYSSKNCRGVPGRTWNANQSYRHQRQSKRLFFKKKTPYQQTQHRPQTSGSKSSIVNDKKT